MQKDLEPEKWVDEYGDLLFNFAYSRVNDRELAFDLVQDTFTAAFAGRSKFEKRAAESTWLISILKNKIIDHYRSKSAKKTTSIDEDFGTDAFNDKEHWQQESLPQFWAKSLDETQENDEFNSILERCLKRLNEMQKAVFSMKYLDDVESETICKELNISASNYWVLVHRAKLQLRTCLEKNWFLA